MQGGAVPLGAHPLTDRLTLEQLEEADCLVRQRQDEAAARVREALGPSPVEREQAPQPKAPT